jgi:uncharacterized Fe-S center protein
MTAQRNLYKYSIVAVRAHTGEAYNGGYIRPVIARTFVDALKEKGFGPFARWDKNKNRSR